MSRIVRSTDIGRALRSRQRGFLLNPFRFGGGGGGGPTELASDSWTQSSGSTQGIAVYGSYEVLEGSLSVLSGTAGVTIGSGAYNTARRTGTTFSASQYSQTVITSNQISLSHYCGPAVRCQSGANTSYHVETAGSNFYVSKCLAGTQSSLAGPVTQTFAAGDVIRLEVTGTGGTVTLKVFRALAASPTSFSQVGTDYTDSSSPITTAGTAGVFGYGNSGTSPVIGAWSAGDL